MNPQTLTRALAAAREAAGAAAEIIGHYWRCGVEVELKSDATPVTIADREAEQAIRKILQAALPQAAITTSSDPSPIRRFTAPPRCSLPLPTSPPDHPGRCHTAPSGAPAFPSLPERRR